jgi:hypothetical protein
MKNLINDKSFFFLPKDYFSHKSDRQKSNYAFNSKYLLLFVCDFQSWYCCAMLAYGKLLKKSH